MRTKLTYRCTECKNENYIGDRNKSKNPDKLEINKYCSNCNKHTIHKEKSKK
ncbi:MAG: 50S ribosomal protein L33 [Mycoplasmataceae bacterium]|nr:50S ribosomal protein L33 [Mycoplasmataceae bacterium]